jgi:hypothetical protein
MPRRRRSGRRPDLHGERSVPLKDALERLVL